MAFNKARKIVSEELDHDEQLLALINASAGGSGYMIGAQTAGQSSPDQYILDHGIRYQGIRGMPLVGDNWLALTHRRLLFFKGATMTLRPRPKGLAVALPLDEVVSLEWFPTTGVQPCRLIPLRPRRGRPLRPLRKRRRRLRHVPGGIRRQGATDPGALTTVTNLVRVRESSRTSTARGVGAPPDGRCLGGRRRQLLDGDADEA